ncbi:unnamed protein product [Owenia fusiformis]|uniref:sphingomyelin phosphodiesterase n=1 Tax=Owenia fusiformis TaxID=6347 RepID=A0A8J1UCW2_OWEFU|nr:unnamed protein product [Owenia fusiformis]
MWCGAKVTSERDLHDFYEKKTHTVNTDIVETSKETNGQIEGRGNEVKNGHEVKPGECLQLRRTDLNFHELTSTPQSSRRRGDLADSSSTTDDSSSLYYYTSSTIEDPFDGTDGAGIKVPQVQTMKTFHPVEYAKINAVRQVISAGELTNLANSTLRDCIKYETDQLAYSLDNVKINNDGVYNSFGNLPLYSKVPYQDSSDTDYGSVTTDSSGPSFDSTLTSDTNQTYHFADTATFTDINISPNPKIAKSDHNNPQKKCVKNTIENSSSISTKNSTLDRTGSRLSRSKKSKDDNCLDPEYTTNCAQAFLNGSLQSPCVKNRHDGSENGDEMKLVVLGGVSVGKTALCQTFVNDQFLDCCLQGVLPTGLYFGGTIRVDGEEENIRIFDHSHTFVRLSSTHHHQHYFRDAIIGADGFVLIYSIVDRKSFDEIRKCIACVNFWRNSKSLPIVLVANKMDVSEDREVTVEEGRQLAFEIGAAFYESSAFLGNYHVTKLFHDLIRQIASVRLRREFEKESAIQSDKLCGAETLLAVNGQAGDQCTPLELPCPTGFECHPDELMCYAEPPPVNGNRPHVWIDCTRDAADCGVFGFEYDVSHPRGSPDDTWCPVTSERHRCVSREALPISPPSPANQLRVMSYNIFEREFAITHDGQRERTCRIPRLFTEQWPYLDVVCFQEGFMGGCWPDHVSLRDLMSQHGWNYNTRTIDDPDETVENGGVYFASRWPIIEEDQHIYTNYSDESVELFVSKGVGYAKVRKSVNGSSRNYNLFCSHLQAGGDFDDIRLGQAGEMRGFADSKGIPQTEPVIYLGDFNTDMYNPFVFDPFIETLGAAMPIIGPDSPLNATIDRMNDIKNISSGGGAPRWRWIDHVVFSNSYLQPVNALQEAHRIFHAPRFPVCWCERCITLEDYMYPDNTECDSTENLGDLSDHHAAIGFLEFP